MHSTMDERENINLSYEKSLNKGRKFKVQESRKSKRGQRNICMTPVKIIHKYFRLFPSLKTPSIDHHLPPQIYTNLGVSEGTNSPL